MGKNGRKNKQSLKRKALIATAIAFAVLVLSSIILINLYITHEAELDKKDFERFELVLGDTEKLKQQLQHKDQAWSLNKGCSRAHIVTGDGAATCEIIMSLEKANINKELVQNTVINFDSALNSNSDLFKQIKSGEDNPPYFLETLSIGMRGGEYIHKTTNMHCGSLRQITKDKQLQLLFSCRDRARDTFYPRTDI